MYCWQKDRSQWLLSIATSHCGNRGGQIHLLPTLDTVQGGQEEPCQKLTHVSLFPGVWSLGADGTGQNVWRSDALSGRGAPRPDQFPEWQGGSCCCFCGILDSSCPFSKLPLSYSVKPHWLSSKSIYCRKPLVVNDSLQVRILTEKGGVTYTLCIC